MSETEKARKESIQIGTSRIEVFQLPCGEYRLSQSQVTKAIGKENYSIIQFLNGKSLEALPHKGSELCKSLAVEGSNKPINPVPIGVATAYWRYWDKKGNLQATAIIDACIRETIERRADEAFGIYRSTEEYNQRIEAAKAISYDSVALLRQVQQLIEMIRANIQFSQTLNKTVHTLMHNQSTTLRSAHDQACALLEIIRLREESEGQEGNKRIEEMRSELQTLNSEIQLLTSKIDKFLPPEG